MARKQLVPYYRALLPGQLPAAITLPEPYADETFTLEGLEVRIIEQGHADAPRQHLPVSLYVPSLSLCVPSLGLVVGGDVLYNHCHQYVAELTPRQLARRAGPGGGAEPEDCGP
ncbi:hypothetical protein [Streptomyces sp. NPDC047453]|uniref:hypothetical protein n=1 Tax=Streptomyces sp. NPDC047453 TaxID=3154812 RepID=UPI0034115717